MPATEPSLRGRAALGEFYANERFHLPALHAELVNRIAVGDTVVDHERVTGLREQPFEVVAVYRISGGLIPDAKRFNPENPEVFWSAKLGKWVMFTNEVNVDAPGGGGTDRNRVYFSDSLTD